jgi:hypothetical protein
MTYCFHDILASDDMQQMKEKKQKKNNLPLRGYLQQNKTIMSVLQQPMVEPNESTSRSHGGEQHKKTVSFTFPEQKCPYTL